METAVFADMTVIRNSVVKYLVTESVALKNYAFAKEVNFVLTLAMQQWRQPETQLGFECFLYTMKNISRVHGIVGARWRDVPRVFCSIVKVMSLILTSDCRCDIQFCCVRDPIASSRCATGK